MEIVQLLLILAALALFAGGVALWSPLLLAAAIVCAAAALYVGVHGAVTGRFTR